MASLGNAPQTYAYAEAVILVMERCDAQTSMNVRSESLAMHKPRVPIPPAPSRVNATLAIVVMAFLAKESQKIAISSF